MIQVIREFSVSWVAKALLILLISSFGIWGVTDFLRPKFRSDVVATVGKETITRVYFYQSFRNEMGRLRSQMGDEFDKNPHLSSILASQVLMNLIQESLLRQELKSLNLLISNETLREIIQSEDAFRDESGHFSKKKFDTLLTHQGFSEAYYLERIKQDLQKRYLIKAIVRGIKMPDLLLKPLIEQLKETRSFDVVTILADLFPIVEVPSEDVLKEFYEANDQMFALPEVRDLSIVILDPKTYQAKISSQKNDKEEIAHQALANVYEIGKEIQDALASGAALEEVSKNMNIPFATLQKVTSFGTNVEGVTKVNSQGPFTESVIKQAFELGEGNESDLSELGDGRFYIVVVDRIEPQSIPPFEVVQEKVEMRYKEALRMKLALKKAKSLKEKIEKGEPFQKIAQENNLSIQHVNNASLLAPLKDFSEEFLMNLFSEPLGGVALAVTPKGVQLVKVQKISANSFKDDQKVQDHVRRIKEEFVEDFLAQFMASLEEQFPVEVNTRTLKEMLQEN